MFGLFQRRKWVPETLTEIRGSYQGLTVTIRNLPCLRDQESGARKYAYSDFGNEFLMGLHQQLGDFRLLCSKLKTGAGVHAFVTLSSYSPVNVELTGTPNKARRQFDSDLADALIEAFKSAQLRA